jgi:hypothetical protein
MKTRFVIMVIVTFAFAALMVAQDTVKKFPTNQVRIAYAKKNILMGLRSGNAGLIEASLMLISKIKMDFPETNVAEVRTVIDSLALASPSGTLRYKAYLASNICANPEWFLMENTILQIEAEIFFIAASQRLQNKLLQTNSF